MDYHNDFAQYLEAAVAFHGHLCLGQVIGVRLAMYGLHLVGISDPLGADRKKLIVFVEIDRCAADAIMTVTREPFRNQGRLTDLIANGKLCADIGLPQLNPEHDRVLICGSPSMLSDLCDMLNGMGFKESPRMGDPADYAIERAFVEK